MAISPPIAVVDYVLDPLERAVSTFVQQFAIFLMAAGTGGLLVTQNWGAAADTAGFAAIISVITSIATFKVPQQSPPVDLFLRVVRTLASSILGTLTADGVTHSVVQTDWKGALAIALPVALTALLKGLGALANTQTAGASLIPQSWRLAAGPALAGVHNTSPAPPLPPGQTGDVLR